VRRIALLLALGACDHVFGIGDPYEDARALASGSDAATDSTTPPLDVLPGDAMMPGEPLVAHFAFDSNLINSADGTAATCSGQCGYISPSHDGTGAALLLTLSGGCVKFSIAGTQKMFTIAMWVNAGTTGVTRVFTRQFAPASSIVGWGLDGQPAKYTFTTFNGSGADSVDATMGMPQGVWRHIAVTYDSMTLRYYIDGNPDNAYVETIVTASDLTAYIGCNADMTSKFSGSIDDVFVYGAALSAAEIQALAMQ
jgi:hypothetical protein